MIELEPDLEYDETLPPPAQSEKVRKKEREFVTTKLEMISAIEARVLEKAYVVGGDEVVIDLEKRAARKRKRQAKREVQKTAKQRNRDRN